MNWNPMEMGDILREPSFEPEKMDMGDLMIR